MHVVKRKTCRVCKSSSLHTVIDLGEQHLQGSFSRSGELSAQRKLSMSLVRCNPMEDENACGLLQAAHTVPPEIMYRTYWYRSGTNKTMRDHLSGLCDDAVSKIVSPDTVLDIGCNDGTLMNYFLAKGLKKDRVWGIDPSNITGEQQNPNVVNDFFPSVAADAKFKSAGDGFDIITAVAMFYDLEDPVCFANAVGSWLTNRGVFVFEMSYLPAMLRQNSYDTICHEHLEYYSLAAIERIMSGAGMKVFDVSENDINGGSIRVFAASENSRERVVSQAVIDMRQQEFELKLEMDEPYHDFQKRADLHRKDLLRLLKKLRDEGKTIHAYGASTKGNTILQWCGIDSSLVSCAADRNSDKWGTRTPGTNIPIVSEHESRKAVPDYYLVLPWHFKTEFLDREKAMMQAGTRFIFPLPTIQIVGG
jgi:SAM-dependent methyltransferase